MPNFINIPASKNFSLLLDLLRCFKFITAKSFSLYSGTKIQNSKRVLERYIEFGLIRKHNIGLFSEKIYIPTLTTKNFVAENSIKYVGKMIINISKLNITNIRHDYLLQLEILKSYNLKTNILIPYNLKKLKKTPDFLLQNNNKKIAIELENSIKSFVRLNLFFVSHMDCINKNFWDEIHIIVANNQIYNTYKKMLTLDFLYGVENINNRFIVNTNIEKFPFKKKYKSRFILKRCHFFL